MTLEHIIRIIRIIRIITYSYLTSLLIYVIVSAVLSDNEPATSTELGPFDNEDMQHGTRTPPNPETGSQLHGYLFTMKAAIHGQEQGLILRQLERFGCTTLFLVYS